MCVIRLLKIVGDDMTVEKVEVYLGEVSESVPVYLTYTHNIAQQDIKKNVVLSIR